MSDEEREEREKKKADPYREEERNKTLDLFLDEVHLRGKNMSNEEREEREKKDKNRKKETYK